jgi:hypothetical protein
MCAVCAFSRSIHNVRRDAVGLATALVAEGEVRRTRLSFVHDGIPVAEQGISLAEKRMAEKGSDLLDMAAFAVRPEGKGEVTRWANQCFRGDRRPTPSAPLAPLVSQGAGRGGPRRPVAHTASVPLGASCHEAAGERMLSALEWLSASGRRRARRPPFPSP